jgi:ABC-type microcin C transport system duplicated ATPase subunit YejF
MLRIILSFTIALSFLSRHPLKFHSRWIPGRVLLLHPLVIILDEPTFALDISVKAQIPGGQ